MKKHMAKIAAAMACMLLFTSCGDMSAGSSNTEKSAAQDSSAIQQQYPAFMRGKQWKGLL